LCNHLHDAHTCVFPGVVIEEPHFWHFSCVTNLTKPTILSNIAFKKFIITTTPVSSQESADMTLHLMMHSWISSSLGMSCGPIPLTAAWILVQNCGPRFHATPSTSPQWIQKISGNFCPCLFVCICQHLWHPLSTNRGTSKLFTSCHYAALTEGCDGA
jgi:hypothetical protein